VHPFDEESQMVDEILESFLRHQQTEATALARASDVLELVPIGPVPARRYLARFHCRGLAWRDGQAVAVELHEVGIQFPPDYLRRISVPEVLTWLSPLDAFAPNIRFPFICVGSIAPATPLVQLLESCHQIITWNKLTLLEEESLQSAACAWARSHPADFPIDTRPLLRRTLSLSFEDVPAAGAA
jgi:hypothetical protein